MRSDPRSATRRRGFSLVLLLSALAFFAGGVASPLLHSHEIAAAGCDAQASADPPACAHCLTAAAPAGSASPVEPPPVAIRRAPPLAESVPAPGTSPNAPAQARSPPFA